MKFPVIFLLLISLAGCGTDKSPSEQNKTAGNTPATVQIAFLADIHLHDFFAAAKDLDASELPLIADFPTSGNGMQGAQTPVLMRSMQAQLNSTRLFNENYFVFRAALDEIAAKGIKLVALPGDFSDDGQPANVKALADILAEYSGKYGMRFFAITGNHDPVRPFSRAGGKKDFLHRSGKEVAVMSPDHPDCLNKSAWQCSNALREWGYADIMETLKSQGFSPSSQDVLYETPFGTADVSKRGWRWCDPGNGSEESDTAENSNTTDENGESCIFMPDASYLVEPVEGLWLLAIDANVYTPKGKVSSLEFNGSGNAGYNALVDYKPELIDWIAGVVKRAEEQNKRLIAFSHFPMADFYDNTQKQLAELFGDTGMQLKRMPSASTTQLLSDLGLRLHMAGHMHLYDIAQPEDTGGLVNVQVPSLAAYQPGYSVVTLNNDGSAQVDTIIQQQVDRFDTLFPVYAKEWQYRKQAGLINWDNTILDAPDYLRFTDAHLKEVVRQRYVGREWPKPLATFIQSQTVGDALEMLVCDNVRRVTDEGLLTMPAITLANDYYRIRNAGQFADLGGREVVYERLSDASLHCELPEAAPVQSQQVRHFVELLSDVAVSRDVTSITVKGV
ncbi:MAG: metallophosphoesterase [Pseudomonadota bacterium]|nr:metallophosphoesterase [Pseudomonadota bacterium]